MFDTKASAVGGVLAVATGATATQITEDWESFITVLVGAAVMLGSQYLRSRGEQVPQLPLPQASTEALDRHRRLQARFDAVDAPPDGENYQPLDRLHEAAILLRDEAAGFERLARGRDLLGQSELQRMSTAIRERGAGLVQLSYAILSSGELGTGLPDAEPDGFYG